MKFVGQSDGWLELCNNVFDIPYKKGWVIFQSIERKTAFISDDDTPLNTLIRRSQQDRISFSGYFCSFSFCSLCM